MPIPEPQPIRIQGKDKGASPPCPAGPQTTGPQRTGPSYGELWPGRKSVGLGRAFVKWAPAGPLYGGPSRAFIQQIPDGPSGGGPQLDPQTAGSCQAVIRRAPA